MEERVADFDENEVTSCYEISEMKRYAEEMEVAATELQISQVLRESMERERALDRWRLREIRETKLQTLRLLEGMVVNEAGIVSEEVQQINELQSELRHAQSEMEVWQGRLEEVQQRNARILEQDPVYLLMMEEQELEAELERLSPHLSRDDGRS